MLSLVLAIGAANGLVLALVLALSRNNRAANCLLALLICAISWRAGIYILGYAGAYDNFPWLTFFPFDLSFAYGPLLWLYVRQLTCGALPPQWQWHFAPVLGQLAYWLICFAFPLPLKWDWYTGGHLQVVAPLGAGAALLSCGLYLLKAYRESVLYRQWLDAGFANRDEARLHELTLLLGAFGLALGGAAGFALFSWLVRPLNYFERFPLMVVFAVLTYALGLLGWRSASIRYPVMTPEAPEARPAEADADHNEADAPPHRRRAQAEAFRDRLIASDWWREEDFDLEAFAQKLGVSTRTLSRALSEGLGVNFRELIGKVRADAVADQLRKGAGEATLLDLAMAAGFRSKASFNRAFLAHYGVTPSAFREKPGSVRAQNPPKRAPGGP